MVNKYIEPLAYIANMFYEVMITNGLSDEEAKNICSIALDGICRYLISIC